MPPVKQDVPDALRPYTFHGLALSLSLIHI